MQQCNSERQNFSFKFELKFFPKKGPFCQPVDRVYSCFDLTDSKFIFFSSTVCKKIWLFVGLINLEPILNWIPPVCLSSRTKQFVSHLNFNEITNFINFEKSVSEIQVPLK